MKESKDNVCRLPLDRGSCRSAFYTDYLCDLFIFLVSVVTLCDGVEVVVRGVAGPSCGEAVGGTRTTLLRRRSAQEPALIRCFISV